MFTAGIVQHADPLDDHIYSSQSYDFAAYAVKARERILEIRNTYGENIPLDLEWELTCLHGQVHDYVMENGYFPAETHLRRYRDRSRSTKKNLPTRRQYRMAIESGSARSLYAAA